MDARYSPVNTCQISDQNGKLFSRPFLRQLLVSSVVWMCFFVGGMGFGSPTVIIPQIRREANSMEAVSEEMASWLSAIYAYGAIPWTLIIPMAASRFGRKKSLIIVCTFTFAAFIVIYTSKSVLQILIGEIMESAMSAALTTITLLILTEYTSPIYRGWFLTFKSGTLFWGIWTANAIGTFFHWKIIVLVKLVCSIYPIGVVFFLPESPYWLASKGKLDECTASHKWLKGNAKTSEQELKTLIDSQQMLTSKLTCSKCDIKYALKTVIKKQFYKPIFLSMVVLLLHILSGKLACSFYSLDIITKITHSEKAAYSGMLILDGFTVLGIYVGCALSKFLRRRTLLLFSSTLGVLSLFLLSLYVYLIKLLIVTENQYISISLLALYSLGICCGPVLLSTSIYGELMPLSNRNTAVFIVALFDKVALGTVLKLTPFAIKKFGLHVVFAFFGVSAGICIILIYKYLPETKDKTLHEIATMMNGNIRKNKATK